jgi:hypothetical protein
MNLAQLDRRWIFVIIFLSVALPLKFPIGLTGEVSPGTHSFHAQIEALGPNDVVIVSFDCEASSWPEIGPVATVLLRHALEQKVAVIGTSFLSEGTALGYDLLAELEREIGGEYGHDWVYLGFRPQYVATMLALGEDLKAEYPQDYLGQSTTRYPLLERVNSYRQIRLVISIADDTMPQYWIEYAGARHGVEIAAGLSAVMVTTFAPYLDSGQLKNILGGLKGAAEYEILRGERGAGLRGMDAQSSAHLAIIMLVLVGNIAFFMKRKES